MKTSPRPRVVTPRAKLELTADEIVADYRVAYRSRVASVLGRREVLTGRAPFGIFGDGKEVAQLALAKQLRDGDWRSGYYRDQTLMFAAGMADLAQFFAQLYTVSDLAAEPHSGGRQMVSHFATRSLEADGRWRRLAEMKNAAADLSPVAGQMGRSLGLAYASKLCRVHDGFRAWARAEGFSVDGDEVCFATIGNAGTSEGVFWETLNAAGVLQVPLAISVWDDGYGISVPNEYQTTKGSISAVLQGFRPEKDVPGVEVHVGKGWDYVGLCDMYALGIAKVRRDHAPAVFHVVEMTQPQGHSTSGSHERYKTAERMRFETEADPIARMREWMIREEIATAGALDAFDAEDRAAVEEIRDGAWRAYQGPMDQARGRALALLERAAEEAPEAGLAPIVEELRDPPELSWRLVRSGLARALLALRGTETPAKRELVSFLDAYARENEERFNSHLYSESPESPLRVPEVAAEYSDRSELVDGRIVLVRYFDQLLARDPRVFVIGEDVGRLGDVNLVFEGLQAKHGPLRLTDTGIREATILGQGIGTAMRGLRPIVDIQYLDYLLYALQLASDDLATLHYRTRGGQKAPVVIRTKGHRLQGIWHTGSPMAMLLGALRGIRIAVPRNMAQAAGFYNTFFRGDDPGIVIEVLSGYRLKERVPDNLGEFTVPLGVPETLRPGRDITLVTYGACCRIALEAAELLEPLGIDVEVVDVRTLQPFDLAHSIVGSLERTGALLVVDEDVPGGASAYVMRHVLEDQEGILHLDVTPRTLTARANRAPVSQDGDYFAKPNRDDVVRACYGIMRERRPADFPALD
ncbi:MAG TPA: thiamine pyrophosphate-dependent enzyme [Candidatus Limnocylindrales bacterium]|nr:thiamine pyrophosphate-dependent enzyme [Candidatus Limnocylindrales bacterium]